MAGEMINEAETEKKKAVLEWKLLHAPSLFNGCSEHAHALKNEQSGAVLEKQPL